MEFTVSRADLVRELNLSQGVVEKKTTIPILSNVLVEADGDKIELTATDLELGIRCSCPARVKKSGAGTIPARRLLDYVRLLPDGDVQVKIADNHWANLTCGRSKTRIAGMSRESFPELPQMPEPLAEIPIGVLSALIGKTVFSISSEESRFTLNGALLVLRKGGVVMVATDGHRLAMIETSEELPGVEGAYRALLPRKAMLELQKLAGDSDPAAMVKFSGDDNHLFFKIGDRLLLSRKLTGNFPDYERVLPERSAAIPCPLNVKNFVPRSNASRSFQTSGPERFACASRPVKCECTPLFPIPARAKRASRWNTRGRRSKSDSMRNISWTSCGPYRTSRWLSTSRIRTAPVRCAPTERRPTTIAT